MGNREGGCWEGKRVGAKGGERVTGLYSVSLHRFERGVRKFIYKTTGKGERKAKKRKGA